MSQVKLVRGRDGEYEVWLDCDRENFTGLCIGSSRVRDAALLEAVRDMAVQLEVLRSLLARSIAAGDNDATIY